MKLWSVQKRQVVEQALEQGMYQPDFSKSSYLAALPYLWELYGVVLDAFNRHNHANLPGLIFGFMGCGQQEVFEIRDIAQFVQVIRNGRAAVKDLWNAFQQNGSVVVELDYDETHADFNPILIDINDFQFLMPPIRLVRPYREYDIYRLLRCIQDGVIEPSVFPSGVVQAHAPCIARENITRIHPMFDLPQ